MKEILGTVVMGTILGFVIAFIMINIVVGCGSWEDGSCVTPREFLEGVFMK